MTFPTAAEIMSYYLYGTQTPPEHKANQAYVLRARDASVTTPDISASAFMDRTSGPGRFALPTQFRVVRRFFNRTDGLENLAAGEYSLRQILFLTGYDDYNPNGIWKNPTLSLQGYQFDDDRDDYGERSFIWGTMGFTINTDALFTVDINGIRSIKSLKIRPEKDNFDFLSDSETSKIFNHYFEHWFDPSRWCQVGAQHC
jgi:hypothetical protein